jgi:ABC-type transporter Mla subunit MlaD
LSEGTQESVHVAHQLVGHLGRERAEMGALAQTLDLQAAKVVDSITQQARMVAEASDLAETQLREAEATLAARAADLAAAAGETSDAARTAGEDLTRHIARLETAGLGVADQIRAVEGSLGEQRTALVTLAQALQSDHMTFTANADAHAATLGEFISQARLSAAEMNDRALKGGDSLRQLMADAAAQFRDLAETAHAEREEFGQSTVLSLESVSAPPPRSAPSWRPRPARRSTPWPPPRKETRAAAASHAASAREQVDQLSEAALSGRAEGQPGVRGPARGGPHAGRTVSVMVDEAGVGDRP